MITESSNQPIAGAARERAEQALALDRNSARVVQLAAARLNTAQTELHDCVFGPPSTVSAAANELLVALAAQAFATEYELTCHRMLDESLDDLAAAPGHYAPSADERVVVVTDSAAAAVVVAEATAIAAAAEERLAAEIQENTVRAARTAHDAAMAAAATVAQAARDARRARDLADALAAVAVAAAAADAAADVQRRAEEVAAMVSAAASVAASELPTPHDAARAMRATTEVTAGELAEASSLVPDATARRSGP